MYIEKHKNTSMHLAVPHDSQGDQVFEARPTRAQALVYLIVPDIRKWKTNAESAVLSADHEFTYILFQM